MSTVHRKHDPVARSQQRAEAALLQIANMRAGNELSRIFVIGPIRVAERALRIRPGRRRRNAV